MDKMTFRRLIKILLISGLALLYQAPSSRNCYAEAFAYIPNGGENNVSIIKIQDNPEVNVTIAVGAGPYGIAVSKEYIYVSNTSDGTVSIINMSSNEIVGDPISVGNSPRGIAASSDDSYLYVANNGADTVSIIDISDSSQTALNVGNGPLGVAIGPDEDYVYVTNNSDDSLSVISATSNELFGTIANHQYINYLNSTDDIAFNKPYGVAVSPDGYFIYVVNNGNNTLSIIYAYTIYYQGDDFNWDDYVPDDDSDGPYSLYEPITVGNDPRCVAVTPDQGYLYVTNYADNTVSVIDLSAFSVTETIDVGNGPYGISVTPSGAFVYVVNQSDGTVSVIDADYYSDTYNTVIKTVDVGNSPTGFGNFIGGKPPMAPSSLEATQESTYTIKLTWRDNSDDELGYKIFRRKYIGGVYYQIATVDKDTTSYIDSGLDVTSNYYYMVAGYNHAGYSDFSNEAYAATGDDSGCFIATAVYGSPMETHVKTLRDFRDRFLTTNSPGNSFLHLYYRYSPPIAHYIEYHKILRFIIRWTLLPVVWISELFLYFGPVLALAILFISIFIIIGTVIVAKRWALSGVQKSIRFC
jgi:YVTN family beta-propeller protein